MITGILLAAGASRRFGSNKLLHPLPTGEIVAIQAYRHLQAAVDKLIVVVRPGDFQLIAQLQALGAELKINPEAEQGMGSSLAFAVQQTLGSTAWLIALADMPFISPNTINTLVQALRAGANIVAPSYQQQRGHPVGFSAQYALELCTLHGDTGAKDLLIKYNDSLSLIAVNDPGILSDIDSPQDLIIK